MKDLVMTEMMTKEDVTAMILSAKKTAGLTWEQIAEKIGMSPVWTRWVFPPFHFPDLLTSPADCMAFIYCP